MLPLPIVLALTHSGKSETILAYLSSYADRYSLRQYIRFKHRVLRLQHTGDPAVASSATIPLADGRRKWTIDWRGPAEQGRDEYDFVCVANGHYADGWMPEVPGLS
jgi:cation diffusion facilitator CzcD-associated flavoprotein CzcO